MGKMTNLSVIEVTSLQRPFESDKLTRVVTCQKRTGLLFSTSDVASRSGAPLRSIRYWALCHVLEAEAETDRAGMGKHRRFSKEEVIIACIVQCLSLRGLQVGPLTSISKYIRTAIRADARMLDCLSDAIRDDFRVYMTVQDEGLERGYITLYSDNPPIYNGRPQTQATVNTTDGVPKTVMLIRPATDDQLAGIFRRMTNEDQGFVAVLLNSCFLHLRPEYK
jgi:hypothetical protein